MTRIASILSALTFTSVAFGQFDVHRDFVLSESNAYGLAPADVLAKGPIIRKLWSADGDLLVFERQIGDATGDDLDILIKGGRPPVRGHEIDSYNVRTRKLRTLVTFEPERGIVNSFSFLAGTHQIAIAAVIGGENPFDRYLLIDADNGKTTTIGDSEMSSMMLSPVKALGIVESFPPRKPTDDGGLAAPPAAAVFVGTRPGLFAPAPDNRKKLIRFFSTSGHFESPIEVPFSMTIHWGADGETLFGWTWKKDAKGGIVRDENKKLMRDMFVIDRKSRKLVPVGGMSDLVEPASPNALIATEGAVNLQGQKKAVGVHLISVRWAAAKPGTDGGAIVTTDGTQPLLAPDDRYIAYNSNNALFVREIMKLDLAVYKNALMAAERTKTLSDAKQCALALIMYASDMDDKFPANNGDIRASISPYLRNNDLMANFNYTYAGGPMSSIENPASTEIGYCTGPGGRAIIFADGHVKWRNDQP